MAETVKERAGECCKLVVDFDKRLLDLELAIRKIDTLQDVDAAFKMANELRKAFDPIIRKVPTICGMAIAFEEINK